MPGSSGRKALGWLRGSATLPCNIRIAYVDRLNEALFSPTSGQSYDFVLRDLAGANRTVSMTAAQITKTPVQNVGTIDTARGRVG